MSDRQPRALAPEFFRSLVHNLPDLVWVKDPDGVFLACNRRFEALLGASESDIVGRTDRDFVSAEMADLYRSRDLAAVAAGRTLVNEERLCFASDGHVEHAQTLKTPLHDEGGRLIGVLGVARDLSDQVRLREDLQRSLAQLHEAERVAQFGSWEHVVEGDRLHWSEQVHAIFETDPANHHPSLDDFWRRVHPDDVAAVQAQYGAALEQRRPYQALHRVLLPDGRVKHVLEHAVMYRDAQGQVVRTLGTVQDVTARVLDERALSERRALFAAVFSQSLDSIAIVDPASGLFVEFNDAAARNLGYSGEEFARLGVADVEALHSRDDILANLARMTGPEPVQFESQHRRKDGQLREVAVSGRGIEVNGRGYVVSIWRDLTEARKAERDIHRLSYFDSLTGLPNRNLLHDRVQQLMTPQAQTEPAALLIVNLDRFHAINDALGRPIGDQVLREAAGRLQQVLPLKDAVLHLGADEFVLLLPPQRGRSAADAGAEALRVADATLAALRAPFCVADNTMEMGVSVGIALLPQGGGDSFSDVMRRADTALHRAKHAAAHRVAFFDESMGETARQQFTLEQALREAIPAGQLRLYLQPQVDVRGRLVAAEALVRWVHPTHGLMPPGDFIPMAESSELIVALDRWVLGAALDFGHKLRQAGRPLRIAVNISPRHFHSPDFVSWVQSALQRHRAAPDDLMLEVTEGLVIENLDDVVNKMQTLGALGIRFSMDDFGTGYSSLAYLKRLPIHELKIDRSFVRDAVGDPDSVALISTILAVAHHMNLEVVAEGIETPQQVALLAGMAPQIRLQGFHFGRPLPLSQWLARWAPGRLQLDDAGDPTHTPPDSPGP